MMRMVGIIKMPTQNRTFEKRSVGVAEIGGIGGVVIGS
jgi:hypothetical protein